MRVGHGELPLVARSPVEDGLHPAELLGAAEPLGDGCELDEQLAQVVGDESLVTARGW